jgi:hypothetical protein
VDDQVAGHDDNRQTDPNSRPPRGDCSAANGMATSTMTRFTSGNDSFE